MSTPSPAAIFTRGPLFEIPEAMKAPRPVVVRGPVEPPPPPTGMAYPPGGLLFIPWALVPPDQTVVA